MAIRSISGTRGIAVAPHALAAQSALDVLREGGNALEAMIAAAATIAVAYPHMNSIGGDSFWLVHVPRRSPRGIDACGAAARAASIDWYAARGLSQAIPFRGGVSANTVAGTVSGWDTAFRLSRKWRGRLPLTRLLGDAIHYAERGVAVTASQATATAAKRAELQAQPGFRDTFLPGNAVPAAGTVFRQPRLAATLQRLARAGLKGGPEGFLPRRPREVRRPGPRRRRQPHHHRGSQAPPRAGGASAHAPAFARHGIQHAAAHAGPGVAADPRHARPA
jgi:oxamate amidohydrolase